MIEILQGNVIEQLRTLPDESVHCCVTSPPYWGLRDYATEGQIGLERTPEEYVGKMVEVFRGVRRVLRRDGTLWLNLGDSYSSGGRDSYDKSLVSRTSGVQNNSAGITRSTPAWAKPKDLLGIPWRVAFALQADGWWLRSDIIWAKPNPMPESVTDRPTKSHEYLFLLTKSANYFYDAEAIKEKGIYGGLPDRVEYDGKWMQSEQQNAFKVMNGTRNKRSVWTVATAPYPEAHFATYPPDLIKPCILAGTSAKGCCTKCGSPWERIVERGLTAHDGDTDCAYDKGTTANRLALLRQAARERGEEYRNESKTIGWQPTCDCEIKEHNPNVTYNRPAVPCTVLDPFAGSGTTGAVALELGRKAILIELNPTYVELIKQRCTITPGLQLC